MAEEKILIFLITLGIIGISTKFMQYYTNASKLHLYIYSVVWGVLLGGSIYLDETFSISTRTYLFLSAAWVLMYAGSFFSYIFFYNEGPVAKGATINKEMLRNLLFGIVLLSILANYFYYKSIYAKLDQLDTLVTLRTDYGKDAIEESSNMFFNIFGRSYNIYIPIAIYLYKSKKLSLLFLIGIILVALVTAGASLTRAPILNVFICIWVSVVVVKVKIKPLYVMLGLGSFFTIIYVVTQQIGMLSGGDSGSSAGFSSTAQLYIFGSLKAFDNLLKGQYVTEHGYDSAYYSLDFFNYFLKKIGAIDTYPSLVRDYTTVIETNVYTYLDAFTLDFGWFGTLICPFLIGFLSGFISSRVKTSDNVTYKVMYAYCCFGIALSFMNNEFIRSN